MLDNILKVGNNENVSKLPTTKTVFQIDGQFRVTRRTELPENSTRLFTYEEPSSDPLATDSVSDAKYAWCDCLAGVIESVIQQALKKGNGVSKVKEFTDEFINAANNHLDHWSPEWKGNDMSHFWNEYEKFWSIAQ